MQISLAAFEFCENIAFLQLRKQSIYFLNDLSVLIVAIIVIQDFALDYFFCYNTALKDGPGEKQN